MERSYYSMYRGWQDHPVFGRDPYSRRDAFEWLIANAARFPCEVEIAGRMVRLETGQLSYSLRFMASKWRWTEPKVRRFLAKLRAEKMIRTGSTTDAPTDAGSDAGIDAPTDAGQTLVTVCNYEKYQIELRETDAGTDAGSDAGSDARATQRKRKSKENELRVLSDSRRANGSTGTAGATGPTKREKVNEVFEHWRVVSGKPQTRLTKERQAKIEARLKTFSVDELKKAIDGAHQNPFYLGDNDRQTYYGDIITIFKNDTAVERHRDYEASTTGGNGQHHEITLSPEFFE